MRPLLTLLLISLPLQAGALDLDNELIGIRLDWNRYDSVLILGETERETRLTHVALMLNEPFGKRFYGGLRLGYVDVSQNDNPDVAGLSIYGNSLGIRLGAFLIHNETIDVILQGDYDYLRANGKEDDQEVDFNWAQSNIQLVAILKLGWLRLSGSAYQYDIDGDQKLRGPINSTTRFNNTENTGTSVGIEFQVDPTGYIGAHSESGAREGMKITFVREF